MDSLLKRLIKESQTTGWAVGSLPTYGFAGSHRVQASTLTWDAKQLGLTPIANREGDDPHSTLRPTAPEDARPASLSAVVGFNAQPLHTDGAHLARVPEYVLLWSAEPNSTPTRVWSPWDAIPMDEQHGMFVVRSGRRTWLAPAIESYRKLRFDPVCMSPGDAAARRLSERLQSAPEDAVTSVIWDSPGKVLLLRNRNVLHGRAAVAADDGNRKLERIALTGSSQ